MNKWYFSLATAVLFCSIGSMQAQQTTTQSSGTKIIVIEEKIDRNGNKTVTRTEKEGNFSDEEINKIIAEESMNTDSVRVVDGEHEPKGYLGVMIENVTGGVRITEVKSGSPAEAAGLKNSDVIVAVGGTEVANLESLVEVVSSHKPGETVQVHYLRDGASATASAVLAVREEPVISDVFGWADDEDDEEKEGVEAEEFKKLKSFEHAQKLHEKMEKHEEKSRPRFGVNIDDVEEGNGVLVTRVFEGSLAEQAGLQEGDIITSFNGVEVNTPDDLIEAVKSAPVDDKVKVNFLRDEKKMKEKVVFERT